MKDSSLYGISLCQAKAYPQNCTFYTDLMPHKNPLFCHVHLVSDSTGETLIAVCRAVSSQFKHVRVLEHIHPLIRNKGQIDQVIASVDRSPGLVLYTLVDEELVEALQSACEELSIPCQSILSPVMQMFGSYLGLEATAQAGAQHSLNNEYFKRIDALNYTMIHDDGQLNHELDSADIILLGISRTSKTPTSIYLANRGFKTANIPLVPNIPPPVHLSQLKKPLIVGLIASPDRISQVRQNRILGLGMKDNGSYADKRQIAGEVNEAKRLFNKYKWPIIDVTRKSIEETAAAIISLYNNHETDF